MGVSRRCPVEEINPLTFKIKTNLSEGQINRLIELFEDTVKITPEHKLVSNPNTRPCGNIVRIHAGFPDHVRREVCEIFRPAIDALSKNKAFMDTFTSEDIDNKKSSWTLRNTRQRPDKSSDWDTYEHLRIEGAQWLRYDDGGQCHGHRDTNVWWDTTLVAFQVFSASEGTGVYQTKMRFQNGGEWTSHNCDVGDGITILRPVQHRVTPCSYPSKRLRAACRKCNSRGIRRSKGGVTCKKCGGSGKAHDVEDRPPTKPVKGPTLAKYYKRFFPCCRPIPYEDQHRYEMEYLTYRDEKAAWKKKVTTWKTQKYLHDTTRLKLSFTISKVRVPVSSPTEL